MHVSFFGIRDFLLFLILLTALGAKAQGRAFEPPNDWFPEPKGSQVEVLRNLILEKEDNANASLIVRVPNACSMELYFMALAQYNVGNYSSAELLVDEAVWTLNQEYYEAEILTNFSLPSPQDVGLSGADYLSWKTKKTTNLLVSLRDSRRQMTKRELFRSVWSNACWAYWSKEDYAVLGSDYDKMWAYNLAAILAYERGDYEIIKEFAEDYFIESTLTFMDGDICAPTVGATRQPVWNIGLHKLAALQMEEKEANVDNTKAIIKTWQIMYNHALKYHAEILSVPTDWDWFFSLGVTALSLDQGSAEACLVAEQGRSYFESNWCSDYLSNCD